MDYLSIYLYLYLSMNLLYNLLTYTDINNNDVGCRNPVEINLNKFTCI